MFIHGIYVILGRFIAVSVKLLKKTSEKIFVIRLRLWKLFWDYILLFSIKVLFQTLKILKAILMIGLFIHKIFFLYHLLFTYETSNFS